MGMKRKSVVRALGLAAVVCALLGGAGVASAGNANGYGDVNALIADGPGRIEDSVPSSNPSNQSFVLSATGYGASITASANGGVAPSVAIAISAASGGDVSDRPQGSGDITNTYYFGVFDSDPNLVGISIPVSLSYDAEVDINPSGSTLYNVFSWLQMQGGVSLSSQYYNIGGTPYQSDGLSGMHTVSASVILNSWNIVILQLSADAGANIWSQAANGYGSVSAPGSITVSAFIDPTVTIDPAWLAANPGAALEFDTLQVVPEPTSLCLLGFGAAMLLVRRRRND